MFINLYLTVLDMKGIGRQQLKISSPSNIIHQIAPCYSILFINYNRLDRFRRGVSIYALFFDGMYCAGRMAIRP